MRPLHGGAHGAPALAGAGLLDVIVIALALGAVGAYLVGVVVSRRRGCGWSSDRIGLWTMGVALAAMSMAGPLAEASHGRFFAHAGAHLLGGMLAPLLLTLAAPVTLALRALHPTPARRLSRVLRSGPGRVVSHPVTAAVLSAGGLWLIYATPVFAWMQASPLIHLAVQVHVVLAGWLFTASVLGIDPAPHAPRRVVIAVVLVATMASHAVLAKHLYANPPVGVDPADAQAGAQLMYYAGAWVEAAIVVIFCARWYRAAGRRQGTARVNQRTGEAAIGSSPLSRSA
ncbi:cytochrome c oxidase assembly protein [Microbacterium sp. NPDC096154]|uniref:cytochrome c oxidase assembly protein n=1 Tax=Microbacterium sp. NPDC096154 TaxID=3155549 RepID=UPI0033223558